MTQNLLTRLRSVFRRPVPRPRPVTTLEELLAVIRRERLRHGLDPETEERRRAADQ